jgi:hypothetical protein
MGAFLRNAILKVRVDFTERDALSVLFSMIKELALGKSPPIVCVMVPHRDAKASRMGPHMPSLLAGSLLP